MALVYKEAGFPADYREAQVRQIMNAVYRLRSIAITGLAGMGKSNLVRFIVSHPQARARYLKDRADDYAFVHVDCAGLACSDEAALLGEISAQLGRAGMPAGSLSHAAQGIRRTLKEQILSLDPGVTLVLALDYFDEAAAGLDKTFFNYLFHLRNIRPGGNLSYIFATRRPMGHLYELQELLDDGCVVGPLGYKDALDSLRRDQARLGAAFDAVQCDRLIACAGGHPGFLKNAAELLSSGQVDTSLSDEELARQMLRSEKVKSLCQELWDDLGPVEQGVLIKAARGAAVFESLDGAAAAYLEQCGVLVRKKGGAIFCPLFETFIRDVKAATSREFRITPVFPNQAGIETPAGEETVTLSPRLFALLMALSDARGQVLSVDETISKVYADEAAGVTNAALSQLVKRLRMALDPHIRRVTNDPTYTCVETVRDVGFRPNF